MLGGDVRSLVIGGSQRGSEARENMAAAQSRGPRWNVDVVRAYRGGNCAVYVGVRAGQDYVLEPSSGNVPSADGWYYIRIKIGRILSWMFCKVNGQSLPSRWGVARWRVTPTGGPRSPSRMVFPLGLGGLSYVGGGWTPRKTVDHNPRLRKRTVSPQCGCTCEFAASLAV